MDDGTFSNWIFSHHVSFCVCAQSLQLNPSLCESIDCSPPVSSVHGSFLARILEWIPIVSFRGSSPPRDQSHVPYIAGGFFTTELPRKPLGAPRLWLFFWIQFLRTLAVLRSTGQIFCRMPFNWNWSYSFLMVRLRLWEEDYWVKALLLIILIKASQYQYDSLLRLTLITSSSRIFEVSSLSSFVFSFSKVYS